MALFNGRFVLRSVCTVSKQKKYLLLPLRLTKFSYSSRFLDTNGNAPNIGLTLEQQSTERSLS